MALKTLGMNTCVQTEKRVMPGYYNIYEEEQIKRKKKLTENEGEPRRVVL